LRHPVVMGADLCSALGDNERGRLRPRAWPKAVLGWIREGAIREGVDPSRNVGPRVLPPENFGNFMPNRAFWGKFMQ